MPRSRGISFKMLFSLPASSVFAFECKFCIYFFRITLVHPGDIVDIFFKSNIHLCKAYLFNIIFNG